MGVVDPLAITQILILANAAGDHRTGSEIGKNKREVTTAWHDRVRLVGSTLPIVKWVDMHVRDDAVSTLAADLPQARQLIAVEMDDTAIEGVRIEIVVVDERTDDLGSLVAGLADEEGAAFSSPAKRPELQFRSSRQPYGLFADNAGLRPP
ncbi:hypothetical protein X768_22610 [Mesorhizobium sp. LSJC265A00]|nr:hypothetical protein X768_22610 [Mesorhizobium sp. LSJC265A00]